MGRETTCDTRDGPVSRAPGSLEGEALDIGKVNSEPEILRQFLRRACCHTRPGKPDIAWDDQAAKAALINALVLDALTLLNTLSSNDTDSDIDADVGIDEAGQALTLWALLAGQDLE